MKSPMNPIGVFHYGRNAPKDEWEPHVIAEFCKAMQRLYRARYKPADAQTRERLLRELDGASVDGLVTTPFGATAIELVGYSPISDRGDALDLDFDLRVDIQTALGAALAKRACWLSVSYRHVVNPAPAARVSRHTVPPRRQFAPVIAELAALLAITPPIDLGEFLSIRFLRPGTPRLLGRLGDRMNLHKDQFPLCSQYFERVRIQGVIPSRTVHIDSNLSGGGVALDRDWVRITVAAKANKSTKSAERANGLPVWLVVHSDGYANHQTIPPRHRSDAVALCREVLLGMPHKFERVYWADRTGFVNAAWAGRVL